MSIDLHCHSTHSDGSNTPSEILALAIERQFKAFSITDHDSISSYEEVAKFPQSEVKIIPGVELSTELDGEQVHVLGYSYIPNSKALEKFCLIARNHRIERNKIILERLNAKGIKILEEDIMKDESLQKSYGRPHIAYALMKKGYVSSIIEAFHRYIGEGKSCYVSGVKWKVQDAIDIIHEAKGFAVIAHPHLIQNRSIVEKLLTLNFDGLEAYYSRYTAKENNRWIKIAKEKNWLATGGSDFHGDIKPNIQFGCASAPEATFKILWNHFLELKDYCPPEC